MSVESLLPHILPALTGVLATLAVRAFPIIVALSMADACSWRDRLLAIAGYTAIAYLALQHSDFRSAPMFPAYAYLLAVSWVPFFVGKKLRFTLVQIAVCFGVFLVLPGLTELRSALVLMLGWEMALASYSYCVDRESAGATFGGYLSFLFVNPTLVYPRRGSVVDAVGLNANGLFRVLQGAGAMLGSGILLSMHGRLETAFGTRASVMVGMALRLPEYYLAHTGLAAMRIGLVRQLGYRVPECYLQPLRAVSPADFWRRWNTYVGGWIRWYVFRPLAFIVRRRGKASSPARRALMQAALILLSFLTVGALHDFYTTLAKRELVVFATIWFGVNGLLLVFWEIAAKAVRRRYSQTSATAIASHVIVVAFAIVFAGMFR